MTAGLRISLRPHPGATRWAERHCLPHLSTVMATISNATAALEESGAEALTLGAPAPSNEDDDPEERPRTNKRRCVRKRPARARSATPHLADAPMVNAAEPSHTVQVRASPEVDPKGAKPRKPRDPRWTTLLLRASTSESVGQGSKNFQLSGVVIQAIDLQLQTHFPHLPRPPSVEFHSLLKHVLQNGLTLGEGFRIAEAHRLRGETWPA